MTERVRKAVGFFVMIARMYYLARFHFNFGVKVLMTYGHFSERMTLKKYFEFFKFVDYDVVVNSYQKIYKTRFRVYLKMISILPVCIIPMIRGWRMKKKWAWFEPDQHLDTPLKKLRQKYAILSLNFILI